MVSLANLSHEERVGLGVAAALHVALVGALVWQVRDTPTPLVIPERMDVSLADEVSLQSTAPDPSAAPQAAIAPVLAPVPEPVVERVPEPVVRPTPAPQPTASRPVVRPTPAPRPTASSRPTPAPTAQPSPRPTQATRGGGSRIGADFLEGTSSGERSESRGTPATQAGPAVRASIASAIIRQIKPHWSAPQGVDAEKLITVLAWELNRDGSLKGRPSVVRQAGVNDSNRLQAPLHAERAIRAVQLAAPFELPDEYYDSWKSIRDASFDRNL